ncbi:DinB family protein [Hymenobacter sp. H14-R3]|uniref:DinB family protein n=1 Tax=Hymenobacter sp. H14-R3 TaxID=3046308 RepID=UPI0024BAE08B|nr:DinB family protein [Hymenobacter sp. H14-R3]MDJ0366048.1 DinB family protein [Hymenobacter sp. H14-R3]
MEISLLVTEIKAELHDTFALVDAWFDQPNTLRAYVPDDQGWTIEEVLNHIGLTNHYLLILIEKGTAKALANLHKLDLQAEVAQYHFEREKLAAIGTLHAFPWQRPGHMEPRAYPRPQPVVRQQLHNQLAQLDGCLDRLAHGEGLLYQTTMSVNGLGKLNVYEYVYFLAQHARRHLTQMRDNATELAAK